jgi:hypothetical protein
MDMHIGGVLLGSGMEMILLPGDYLNGQQRLHFMIGQIVGVDNVWIILDGYQRPTATSAWTSRRVRVRIAALKRSMALV